MPHYLIIPGDKVNGSAGDLSDLGFKIKDALLGVMSPAIEVDSGIYLPVDLITVNLKSVDQKGNVCEARVIYVSFEQCRQKQAHLQNLGFRYDEIHIKQLCGSFQDSLDLCSVIFSKMTHHPEEFAITYLGGVEV